MEEMRLPTIRRSLLLNRQPEKLLKGRLPRLAQTGEQHGRARASTRKRPPCCDHHSRLAVGGEWFFMQTKKKSRLQAVGSDADYTDDDEDYGAGESEPVDDSIPMRTNLDDSENPEKATRRICDGGCYDAGELRDFIRFMPDDGS